MPNVTIEETELVLRQVRNNNVPEEDGLAIKAINQGGSSISLALQFLFDAFLLKK